MGFADVVLAGSPEFLDALLVPLQGRLGASPRVADTPHQAFALCQGSADLLVYEFRGREWLPLCADLRSLAGTGLVIVVALPPEHAADAAALSGAASAVVPWGGDPRAVLEAVARLDARPAPPARARAAPVLTPPPGRAAAPPPVPRPPAVRAPAAPPAVPRAVPGGPPALRMVPPPAAAPAASRAGAVPALAPEGARAAAPAIQLVPPVEEADPFAHLFEEGEAAPVPARPPPAPAPAAPPAVGSAAPPAAGPEAPSVEAPPADAVPEPTPPPEALPFVPSGTWPGTVLPAEDAEGLLSGALVGLWPEEPLRPLTERVVEGLSTAEKQALQLQDASLPFEAGPIRRAAGLRWQVASALATAPLPAADGTLPPVDPAAVRAILSGIDAVLADLKRMSEGAGPEALRAIENVRHLLVKEAIDLTEVVQRLVPEGTAEMAVAGGAPAAPQAPGTRVLSNVKGRNDVARPTPWGLIVVLGLALAAAGAYHAHRWVNRPVPPPSAIRGAPTGTVGVVQPQAKILVAPAGQKLDPREVEAFKNQEQAKGNEVREVLPGTFVVVPPSAPPAGGEPATPKGTAP